MAKVIAIANQKGGVAKSTTASALAAGLKNRGFKVLAIDMDPQGNLSDSIGAETYESPTVYELLKREISATETIQHKIFDIIPSNIMLAGADQELSQTGKEHRLKEMISSVVNEYDFIVIDTPPALGVLTVNAFTLADEVIVPTTPGIFAAKGINQLYSTIQNVRKYCNPNVKIVGILITRFNPRATINQDIKTLTEQLASHMDAPIFKTFIRNSVVVEEAQANMQDIYSWKPNTTVAEDYNNFVNEYLRIK